jgi:hypothetical protein
MLKIFLISLVFIFLLICFDLLNQTKKINCFQIDSVKFLKIFSKEFDGCFIPKITSKIFHFPNTTAAISATFLAYIGEIAKFGIQNLNIIFKVN